MRSKIKASQRFRSLSQEEVRRERGASLLVSPPLDQTRKTGVSRSSEELRDNLFPCRKEVSS